MSTTSIYPLYPTFLFSFSDIGEVVSFDVSSSGQLFCLIRLTSSNYRIIEYVGNINVIVEFSLNDSVFELICFSRELFLLTTMNSAFFLSQGQLSEFEGNPQLLNALHICGIPNGNFWVGYDLEQQVIEAGVSIPIEAKYGLLFLSKDGEMLNRYERYIPREVPSIVDGVESLYPVSDDELWVTDVYNLMFLSKGDLRCILSKSKFNDLDMFTIMDNFLLYSGSYCGNPTQTRITYHHIFCDEVIEFELYKQSNELLFIDYLSSSKTTSTNFKPIGRAELLYLFDRENVYLVDKHLVNETLRSNKALEPTSGPLAIRTTGR